MAFSGGPACPPRRSRIEEPPRGAGPTKPEVDRGAPFLFPRGRRPMASVPIRAHNLLCLLGYRGRGYDANFIARMTAVHRQLRADPETRVQVLTSADTFCS